MLNIRKIYSVNIKQKGKEAVKIIQKTGSYDLEELSKKYKKNKDLPGLFYALNCVVLDSICDLNPKYEVNEDGTIENDFYDLDKYKEDIDAIEDAIWKKSRAYKYALYHDYSLSSINWDDKLVDEAINRILGVTKAWADTIDLPAEKRLWIELNRGNL